MTLADVRTQLTAQLAGLGVPVHEYVPEEPAPPCVILQPAENFVSEDPGGATYAGEVLVSYDVLALVLLDEEHANADAGAQLDQLLAGVLDSVRADGSDWWLQSIGQPQAMYTSDWLHHGVRVTVQTRVTL